MAESSITPIPADNDIQEAPRLTINPSITAPDGSFYVFDGQSGYRQVVPPHERDLYVPPFTAAEKLGNIESWCAFVQRFSLDSVTPLLVWSQTGLRAILDYGEMDAPGRRRAVAEHPFQRTRQWDAWQRIASGNAIGQKQLIEALEDHRQDIRDPDAATMVGLIRMLRANVNVEAEAELETNGNTRLSYRRQTSTSVELPQILTIGIPVLKGHTAPDGHGVEGPVRYAIEVLVRVDVLDGGKLAFRLSMPNAEQALEDAVADRVARASELLGDGYQLLRATA